MKSRMREHCGPAGGPDAAIRVHRRLGVGGVSAASASATADGASDSGPVRGPPAESRDRRGQSAGPTTPRARPLATGHAPPAQARSPKHGRLPGVTPRQPRIVAAPAASEPKARASDPAGLSAAMPAIRGGRPVKRVSRHRQCHRPQAGTRCSRPPPPAAAPLDAPSPPSSLRRRHRRRHRSLR